MMTPRAPFLVVPADPSDIRTFSESADLALASLGERDRKIVTQNMREHGGFPGVCFACFLARRGTTVLGALFSRRNPDGTVELWPPGVSKERCCDDAEACAVRTALYECFDRNCRDWGVRAAVALCEPQARREQRELLRGRFEPLSELLQLVAEERAFPMEPARNTLCFVSCAERLRELGRAELDWQLCSLAERTYVETLDFPRLTGVVPVENIFQTYRREDGFRDDLWYLIYDRSQGRSREESHAVGLLFLTDRPDDMQVNLTYMGLVPESRGKKFGSQIVQFALWKTRSLGRRWIFVSLDGDNVPALRTYLQNGFRPWNRKSLFAKFYSRYDTPDER